MHVYTVPYCHNSMCFAVSESVSCLMLASASRASFQETLNWCRQFSLGTTISKYHLALLSCEMPRSVHLRFTMYVLPKPVLDRDISPTVQLSEDEQVITQILFNSLAIQGDSTMSNPPMETKGLQEQEDCKIIWWYGKPRKHFTASWSLKHGSMVQRKSGFRNIRNCNK